MTSRAALGWPGEPPGADLVLPADALAASDVPGWLVIADELPDGLVVADETGQVTVFNTAAAQLTGVNPAEALGKELFDILPLHDADGRDWWALADPYHGLRTRTRHPERPLSVAHELRSPLTSVKGFTATLLAKWHRFTEDQKLVMLETVNADADRVTRLITELLDVSRIESGRLEVHRQLVDVPERARKIMAGRVAAGEPEDRFRLSVADGLPETWLDPDKVDQILANLVENAVRHGAGTVTVVVEPAAGGDVVAVSVQDEGEGIAPDLASRVFRQFWRGKRRGGTGLGLYIVKGLVEAHAGTITVGRAPGGGAEFRFTMPAGTPLA